MDTALENMGFLGLMDPFTVLDLRDRMRISVPDVTSANVKALWEAYTDAVLEKKLAPFLKDAEWVPTFNDLVAVTGLPKMTVSAFLTSLRAQAEATGSNQYLDPGKGQQSRTEAVDLVKQIISTPAKVLRTATQPVVDTGTAALNSISAPLKWTAIGLAAAAVLYIGWQILPLTQSANKAKKKKG